MAASRGLHQPRIVLSGRDSGGCSIGFYSAFEGEGAMDRCSSRIISAECSASHYNKSYRLEKRGFSHTYFLILSTYHFYFIIRYS